MTTINSTSAVFEVGRLARPARARVRITPLSWPQRLRLVAFAADTVVLTVALTLSTLVWTRGRDGLHLAHSSFLTPTVVAVFTGLVWLATLGLVDSRRLTVMGAGPREYRLVMVGSARALGIVAITGWILDLEVSRLFLLNAFVAGGLMLLTERWLLRGRLARSRARGENMVPTVVVGGQDDLAPMLRQLQSNPGAGYQPIGVCVPTGGASEVTMAGLPRIPVEVLAGMLRPMPRAAVVVAGGVSDPEVQRITGALEGSPVQVMLVPRLLDVPGQRMSFMQAAGLNLVHVTLPQFRGAKYVVKRSFDVLFAGAALIALLPVFALIALLIKLEDGGPVIYRQTRVGLRGESFTIHKFRSMHLDADKRLAELQAFSQGAGPLFKMEHDPRITRTGAFLRKHSLDELPQFWTVLRSGMSVVGPRPHLAAELDEFPQHALRRLLIKPGITGLWQVGGRSDLSLDDAIRLDLRYVENWTLGEDVSIILKTVRHVLVPQGAY
jgi:exopolysaccharide biosynthesis polyprenyl glycosylphosphotransferase